MLNLIFSQVEQINKQGPETKEDSSAERKTWQVWEKESVEVRTEGVQRGFLSERRATGRSFHAEGPKTAGTTCGN